MWAGCSGVTGGLLLGGIMGLSSDMWIVLEEKEKRGGKYLSRSQLLWSVKWKSSAFLNQKWPYITTLVQFNYKVWTKSHLCCYWPFREICECPPTADIYLKRIQIDTNQRGRAAVLMTAMLCLGENQILSAKFPVLTCSLEKVQKKKIG